MAKKKYDILSIPISAIELDSAGPMFRKEAMQEKYRSEWMQWEKLLRSGYKVHSFSIVGSNFVFLFEL